MPLGSLDDAFSRGVVCTSPPEAVGQREQRRLSLTPKRRVFPTKTQTQIAHAIVVAWDLKRRNNPIAKTNLPFTDGEGGVGGGESDPSPSPRNVAPAWWARHQRQAKMDGISPQSREGAFKVPMHFFGRIKKVDLMNCQSCALLDRVTLQSAARRWPAIAPVFTGICSENRGNAKTAYSFAA